MDLLHSSPDDDEEASAAAMAAAMGFSSFGTQGNPTKKRKFNAVTDAFVDGQELASLDKGGRKGQGSGGNTIPLGKPRTFGVATAPLTAVAKSNGDEIDLDDGEEEEGPHYIDTSLPSPIEMQGGRDRENMEKQERIDAVLASIRPALNGLPMVQQLPQPPVAYGGDTVFMQGNSRPAVFGNAASIASSPRQGNRGHGQKNDLWYVGYYDQSFNENPWARMEKEHGLESRGSWV